MRRGDDWRVDLVLRAMATSDDDRADLLTYFLGRAYEGEAVLDLIRLVHPRLDDPDPDVATGAEELLDGLGI
jgi:hypothetical protein